MGDKMLDIRLNGYPMNTNHAAVLKAFSGAKLKVVGSSRKKIMTKNMYEEREKFVKKTPNIDKIVMYVTPSLQFRNMMMFSVLGFALDQWSFSLSTCISSFLIKRYKLAYSFSLKLVVRI